MDAPSSPPPNVLFVMADQHMASLLGVEGHPHVRTPHLDRLAAGGLRFTRAYTQNPICTPSRVSLLSGQYPHNHGYYGLSGPTPRALPSFLGHFRRHGYLTAAIGKLHLPDDPRNWIAGDVDDFGDCYRTIDGTPGESEYFQYLEGLGLRHLEDSRKLPEAADMAASSHDSRPSRLPYEHSVEGWIVRRSTAFIDRARQAGRPFCMEVSFPRPHHQLTPDRQFWDLYPDDLPLPETLEADASHRPPHFRAMVERLRENRWLFEPREFTAGCRRVWRGYLACISQVDHSVGLLLDHLERCGLAGSTIVVYGADHGAYHGAFGVPEKAPGICSEAVCRVPFLWRVPGLTPPGRACAQLVENVDLAATLPGLCGLEAMDTTDGCDLAPLLRGEDRPVRQVAVTENPWSKAVRWDGWRFVHYPRSMFGEDTGELYDLDRDPLESRNLYQDPRHREVVAEGRRRLLEWLVGTSRTVTSFPSADGTEPGRHRYETAADGREPHASGPEARRRRGQLNYL